jgi:hypothetical protein
MIFYIIIFILGFVVGCIAYSDAISVEIRKCKTTQELIDLLVKLKLIKSRHKTKQ